MGQDAEFFRIFREINGQFSRLYAHLLNKQGLTLQQYSLLNLLRLRGAFSMTEASDMLSITKPAVTNIVDQLEKDKLISRQPHPEDRRIYLLEIQPKGLKKTDKIQDVIFETVGDTFAGYPKEQREIVYKFYDNLSKNLTKQFEKQVGKKSA